MWQDNFTLTEPEKVLNIFKSRLFDSDRIHHEVLQNWGTDTKLALLDIFNIAGLNQFGLGELQRTFSSMKLIRALLHCIKFLTLIKNKP